MIQWNKIMCEIEKDNLKALKEQVSKHNKRFIENNQEDGAEFLSTLICGIGK